VDAPCSGVGTWQRNPHARWKTTLDDVRELAAAQRALLEHVVAALKPHGRLIYAACTLTRSETTTLAAQFTAAHAELEAQRLFRTEAESPSKQDSSSASPSLDPVSQLLLWPHELNANGMFIAAWRHR
jgi:16S rRNA (cytosine967-C5)-methyltransferase